MAATEYEDSRRFATLGERAESNIMEFTFYHTELSKGASRE